MPTRNSPFQASRFASTSLRRCAARCVFIVTVIVILLDIIPPTWPGFSTPKNWLSQVLNRLGLWQGQWAMFAPDPVLQNASLAAEFETEDEKTETWESPNWKHVGTWEKLYRFREINFYNRIHLDRCRPALHDFATYLVKHEATSPVVNLEIFHNSMSLLVDEDETIPSRDNWIWISRSDFLMERRINP